jgi:hypothetical protein
MARGTEMWRGSGRGGSWWAGPTRGRVFASVVVGEGDEGDEGDNEKVYESGKREVSSAPSVNEGRIMDQLLRLFRFRD